MNTEKTALLGQKQASSKVEPVTLRRVSVRPPKLRHHKPTGQGYVVLNGKYIFFGPYGDSEVTEQYHRTIAEWIANGRQQQKTPEEITINELLADYVPAIVEGSWRLH